MNSSLPITVTGTVNAGICISFPNGRKLWFDLYPDMETPLFSCMSPEEWESTKKDPRFTPPDLVFFTHIHPDHFSFSRTAEVNRLWPEVPVYFPEQTDPEAAAKAADLSFFPVKGEGVTVSLDGITVQMFRTVHSGQIFAGVPHCSILIRYCGKTIFLSGDALLTSDELISRLECTRTDLAILTFPWASVSMGRERVEYSIQPSHLLLYHIPRAERNPNGFREAALSGSELLNIPDVRLLMEPFQQEVFQL